MAFEIPLSQIGPHYKKALDQLVRITTLEAEGRLKAKTPYDTGNLRNSWRSDPEKGLVTNNAKYAEPVCYGTNLPESWGGEYRTRQNTTPGFPDLIAKELGPWAQDLFRKLAK